MFVPFPMIPINRAGLAQRRAHTISIDLLDKMDLLVRFKEVVLEEWKFTSGEVRIFLLKIGVLTPFSMF